MTPNVLTVDRGADERTLPSFRPSPTLIVGFRRAIRNASETAIHRTLSLLDRTTNNTLYYIERNDLPHAANAMPTSNNISVALPASLLSRLYL